MKSYKHPDYIIAQKKRLMRVRRLGNYAMRISWIKILRDYIGVIYYSAIIIFCQEKNTLALEKGALSLPKYLVICTCIWNSIYDKDIILIYLKKNSNIC